MMMTMIRRGFFLLAFCLVSLPSLSQKKDFGIWYDASAELDLLKHLELDLTTCFRTFDKAAKLEEAFLESELSYKFNKYLSAGASYRITENIEDDDAYHIRHKWFADVKGTLPLGRFKFSGRAMFQQRFKTYIEDENDKLPSSHGRFRLKAQYNFPAFPLDPYIYTELFCPLFKESDRIIDKKRAGAGLELDITSHHSCEIEYLFQRDYFPKLIDEHILSLSYTFKF
jgi:hypothetical protein